MVETFPYERRPSYPHMKPYDTEIWDRFVFEYPNDYDMVGYDVPVGPGSPGDPVVNQDTGGDIYVLYQRKIDVVGRKGKRVDIIEVKPNAGPSAIGQVKYYKKLFVEDFKPKIPVRCVIITDEPAAGMVDFAAIEGVQLVIMGK